MKSTTRISVGALLFIASLAASPAAWSLGLGDATVESYLNQPLVARIELITQETDDLSSVSAKLASAADYELIGASLEDLAVPVQFSVENVGGDAYILARSDLPVSSPIVRLIVEVNWASGRMLREYTLFLDPPTVADQAAPLPRIEQREAPRPAAPQPAPRAVPEPASEPASEPDTAEATATQAPRVEAEQSPASVPAPPARTTVSGAAQYGPVASGDTLWRIANDWAGERGIGVNQAMLAIQQENPEAFLNNNINLLKRGAILRMPSIDEVRDIPAGVAYNEVVAQEEAFRQGRLYRSGLSPATPLLSEDRAADAEEFTIPDLVPEEETAAEAPADEPAAETEASRPTSDVESAEELDAPSDGEESSEADTDTGQAEESAPEAEVADQLELVPPSEASDLDSTYGFEETPSDGDAAMAAQALRENLARAEEDLINQQQQNEYLQERIRELESALDEAQRDTVADPELAAMEQRLREQREATQPAADTKPWYSRIGVWLLGLLLLVAVIAGWLFSRRSGDSAEEQAIQDIKDEAEEVLRMLEDSEASAAPAAGEKDAGQESEDGSTDEAAEEAAADADDDEPQTPETKPPAKQFGGGDDEASFLDSESSDPEIQLDLARAYISMGDKEAARVILDEVEARGSEAQQAEARKMLDLL